MSIELIKDREIWDTFVDETRYGKLFHKWDFLKITEKYSNFRLFTYGIFKGDMILALFPFFLKKKRTLNLIFSPPPYTDIPYLGFLMYKDYDDLKQSKKEGCLNYLTKDIDKMLDEYHPDYISIRTAPSFIDIRCFKWNNYSVEPDFIYFFNLMKSNEELWSGLKHKIRNNIKEAEKLGMKMTNGLDQHEYCNMMETRFDKADRSLPYMNKYYINDLIKSFPENIRINYLLSKNNEILNGLITQEYKKYYVIWKGCLKTEMPGTEYMIWNAIQEAKRKGCIIAENPGADIKRLNEFKSKFNPELGLFYRISKETNRGKIGSYIYKNIYKRKSI